MVFAVCQAVFCAGLYFVASVEAATITNRSIEQETIAVIEGDTERNVEIGPSETIQICSSGCVVRLSNGDEYELFGDERVSIEEGLMFLDIPLRPE